MPVPPGGGGASRWQLALLLGAPIALGLGYLYLRRRHDRHEQQQKQQPALSAPVSLDDQPASANASSAGGGGDLELALRYKVQGNKAFHAAEYDEATQLYERAIAACPPERAHELATFYQNRSACHEKRERWDLVKRDCTEALRLNNRYVRAFLRRARAAEKSGDLLMALEDMTAACILDGFKDRASLLSTDRVLKALGRRHAKEAVESRPALEPSHRFVKAYTSSFSRDPALVVEPPAEGGFAEARAALAERRYADVERGCTAEIEANGRHEPEARLLRGTFRLLASKNAGALEDLDAVADNPLRGDALRVNALIKRASLRLQASEEPGACLADFEAALRLDANDCDLRFHRGQARMLAGDAGGARADFAEALKLNPGFAIARAQLHYAEYNELKLANRVDDLPAVMEAFEAALRDFPDYAETYVLYAEVLSDLERFPRAVELFDKAIAIEPDNANVYVHKAILMLKMSGDVDAAVRLIQEAIRVDDRCLFAYETLGTIEVQRENLKEAVALFEKAIPLTRSESEMTHIFSLRDAANAQIKVSEQWGIGANFSLLG